jgi:hypothetical protein
MGERRHCSGADIGDNNCLAVVERDSLRVEF